MDNLIQVNKVKRIGDLFAPSKSLLNTNVTFMFLKILEYAPVASILKSNSSLKWSEVLKEAFMSTLLCEALVDFSFNFDVNTSVVICKGIFYDCEG